jgi:DNA-binding MarR family transcriptional regulator
MMATRGSTREQLAERMADLTYALLDNCRLKIERTAARLNLTVAEFKLLRLMGNDDVLAVGELTRRMALSSSRLTRILDGLVAKGFARREPDTNDRRVIVVLLTNAGRKSQSDARALYLETHKEIIDQLSPAAAESAILAMEKLGEAMKKWIKE